MGKVCCNCKEDKSTAHFIACNSIVFNGSLPICRECLSSLIGAAADKPDEWNVVDKICQMADVPFVPGEWDKVRKAHGKEALGKYMSIFRSKPYDSLDWSSYNNAYMRLKEENRVEDAIPELREDEEKRLSQKWGAHYDLEDLEYLENLHQGIIKSQNIVGALNEDQAMKICKISLVIEQKIRAGMDFSKELKSYDELVKSANFESKAIRDGNEFESTGEIFAYLEKTGWVNDYDYGAPRDEVDITMKNVKNWLRYLYVNETGIGEEIKERIENLKVAAKLQEEEDFNASEFTDYCKAQARELNEEFKVEL